MWFKSGVGFGELGTGGHVLPYPAGSGDRQSRRLDKVQVDRFLWNKAGGNLGPCFPLFACPWDPLGENYGFFMGFLDPLLHPAVLPLPAQGCRFPSIAGNILSPVLPGHPPCHPHCCFHLMRETYSQDSL